MNATTFFNAVKPAQKSAVIGFLTISGLGIATISATLISALLALLIPVLVTATKAAIFGYPLFLAGLIAIKIKEQCQTKEALTLAILPPGKLHQKNLKQIETIQNEVLVTPPSAETIFDYHLTSKQPTWQQQILKEIRQDWRLPTENQPTTEIQEASKSTEALARSGLDIASRRDAKPLNNQLALITICWQAISKTATLLDAIKSSELKTIASQLQITRYRNMNKTQLLVSITDAFDNIPVFSQ